MTSTRKSQNTQDSLSSIRYIPASADYDPEDICIDDHKLAIICSSEEPSNGSVHRVNSLVTSSATPSITSPALTSPFTYYDFQDTDENDSEGGDGGGSGGGGGGGGGGRDLEMGESCSPSVSRNSSHHRRHDSHPEKSHHHLHCSDRHRHQHHQPNNDVRCSRDLSKSPLSRGSSRGGKGRCMCCMMCIFLLSTAGLGAVLALTYAGEMHLHPSSNRRMSQNGVDKIDRKEDEKITTEICESRDCMETSAAILSRMNLTADPCTDFYNYACGGYNEKAYLSWFTTRIRESTEELMQHYRKYAIDRLSRSYDAGDSTTLSNARTLFRSCLFRASTVDEKTRAIVADVTDSLGGLAMPESSSGKLDLTPLVANVTRLYGATPFFRVIVHAPRKISVVSRFSEYQNPLQRFSSVLTRSTETSSDQDGKLSRQSLEELLTSMLARTNYTGASTAVQDFLRLESNIRRILKSDDAKDKNIEEDPSCNENSRSSFSELQMRYNGYGINWTEFVRHVLDLPSTREVVVCCVRLSRPLQHLLEITPKTSLWQFAILHTLVHSDLFLLVSGHNSQFARNAPNFRIHPGTSGSFADGAQETITPQSPEGECLDLVEYVIPSLKNALHCDSEALQDSSVQVESHSEQLRLSLFGILKELFHISAEKSWMITNSTVNKVKTNVLSFLSSFRQNQEQEPTSLDLDEYDFSSNILELVKVRNQQYFSGKVRTRGLPADMTAFGIRACFKDSNLARPGPQLYHSSVPHAVRFGSMGTFLAVKVADNLGHADVLDHFIDGVLNHSAVLGLAVKLHCLVTMYSKMVLLDYGTQVYKVDGEKSKEQLWKDQLALQMVMTAWRTYHKSMTTDKSLLGIPLSRDQLFYVAYAQTQCEKVSERGVLQHYISHLETPALPSRHRVNGPVQNLHDFRSAFQCSSSSSQFKEICDLF